MTVPPFISEKINVKHLVSQNRKHFAQIPNIAQKLNVDIQFKKDINKKIAFLEFSLNNLRNPKFADLGPTLLAKLQLELANIYLIKNRIMDAYELLYDIIHNPNADLNSSAEALLKFGQIYETGCPEIDINLDHALTCYKWILKNPLGISEEIRYRAALHLSFIEDDKCDKFAFEEEIKSKKELEKLDLQNYIESKFKPIDLRHTKDFQQQKILKKISEKINNTNYLKAFPTEIELPELNLDDHYSEEYSIEYEEKKIQDILENDGDKF